MLVKALWVVFGVVFTTVVVLVFLQVSSVTSGDEGAPNDPPEQEITQQPEEEAPKDQQPPEEEVPKVQQPPDQEAPKGQQPPYKQGSKY